MFARASPNNPDRAIHSVVDDDKTRLRPSPADVHRNSIHHSLALTHDVGGAIQNRAMNGSETGADDSEVKKTPQYFRVPEPVPVSPRAVPPDFGGLAGLNASVSRIMDPLLEASAAWSSAALMAVDTDAQSKLVRSMQHPERIAPIDLELFVDTSPQETAEHTKRAADLMEAQNAATTQLIELSASTLLAAQSQQAAIKLQTDLSRAQADVTQKQATFVKWMAWASLSVAVASLVIAGFALFA